MICPWAACSNCAKHIAASGIKKLVRHTFANNGADTGSHWYDDCLVGDEILRDAGVQIVEMDPISTTLRLRRNGNSWPEIMTQEEARRALLSAFHVHKVESDK